MLKKPKKRTPSDKPNKNVSRETVSDPKPTYVYRKDAFKKVKIT